MSQRLSRKDLKHDIRDDAFHHGVEASYEYVAGHRRLLLGAIGGVIAVALLIAGVRVYLLQRERAANEALGEAVKVTAAPIVATGAKPDDPQEPSFPDEKTRDARAVTLLERLREEHGSSGAAAVATVQLGRLRLQAGDEAGARQLWEEFLDDHEGHLLAGAVRVSLLDLDRRAGKAEQVVNELEAALEDDDRPLPEDILLYELAVTREQLGRAEAAREAYQRLSQEYPDSPFAARAGAKARELGGDSPGAPAPSFTAQPS
jgi:tetratricopeptide (TPR) repeat protein